MDEPEFRRGPGRPRTATAYQVRWNWLALAIVEGLVKGANESFSKACTDAAAILAGAMFKDCKIFKGGPKIAHLGGRRRPLSGAAIERRVLRIVFFERDVERIIDNTRYFASRVAHPVYRALDAPAELRNEPPAAAFAAIQMLVQLRNPQFVPPMINDRFKGPTRKMRLKVTNFDADAAWRSLESAA